MLTRAGGAPFSLCEFGESTGLGAVQAGSRADSRSQTAKKEVTT